jgi:hypothetical protein
MAEKKYNYVYRIVNKLNNMEYVGVHSTDNLNDNYFGSGTYLNNAIKKYGKENFTKEIIKTFDSRQSALNEENRIVCVDYVKKNTVYNLVLGGGTPCNRELSIKKFKRGEERQRFIPFNNPDTELDHYIANIPIEERLTFYGDKEALKKLMAPSCLRYLYLSMKKDKGEKLNKSEEYEFSGEFLRYKIGTFLANNIGGMADDLTKCYNNKKHKESALRMLNHLYSRGMLGTAIGVKGYSLA